MDEMAEYRRPRAPMDIALNLADEARLAKFAFWGFDLFCELDEPKRDTIACQLERVVNLVEEMVRVLDNNVSGTPDDIVLAGDCEHGLRVRP